MRKVLVGFSETNSANSRSVEDARVDAGLVEITVLGFLCILLYGNRNRNRWDFELFSIFLKL